MQVKKVKKLDSFLLPDSGEWNNVKAVEVPLIPTPQPMQPTEYIRVKWENKPYGQTPNVAVKAVHDNQKAAFHLTWFSGSRHPKDAAAIALPVRGEPILVMMGAKDAPIHFLHWMAGQEQVRSTFSQGIGTTSPGEDVLPEGQAVWKDGYWHLVITRALGGKENVAPLYAGKTTKIGFAIWNGANDERAGLKAFSIDWKTLALEA